MRSIPFILPLTGQLTVVIQEAETAYTVPHHHKESQITLIQKGSGTFYIGNSTHLFADGDLFVVGGGEPHFFKSDPPDFHAIHVFFDAQKILEASKHLVEFQAIGSFLEIIRLGVRASSSAHPVLYQRILSIKDGAELERLLCLLLSLQYISAHSTGMDYLVQGATRYPIHGGMRLSAVYQYTLAHFTDDISLSEVASVACLSIPAFCKYFKKHTRKTYFAFLNEVRVGEACKKMLSRDYYNISSVAYATGFNNAITFNRVFKKIMGKCPTDYLQEHASSIPPP